jgi:hypothetical protein
MRRMFDVGDSLRDAFTDARRRLHDAQAAVAAADSGSGGRAADAAMGQVVKAGARSGLLRGISACRAGRRDEKGVALSFR